MYSFANRVSPIAQRGVAKSLPSSPKARFVPRPRFSFPSRPPIRQRRACRSLQCQAEGKSAPATGKDAPLTEFAKLLDSSQARSAEWLDEVQSCGRQLASHVEELRTAVSQKSSELGIVQERLSEMAALLDQARELQTTTASQLAMRSNEVELLKEQLNGLQHDRDEDVTASMERYRELEGALALVESELRSQSESFHSKDASNPVDVGKLSEIVQEQDAVFQNLAASLKMASEEKARAEEMAQEARRKADEMERMQVQLQQDQELLTKELSQLQILYAEKEMEWMNDVRNVQQDNEKLKEESVGLEVTLATKDRKLTTLTTSFDAMKSDFEESQTRLAELRRECAELKSVNGTLEEQWKTGGRTPDQQAFTHLKSQLARLQVRVPVLEAEIDEMTERRKKTEQQYTALEKERVRFERKCVQLEQRASILQVSMEEKSNRLVAAHTEKKSLKSDADRLHREAASLRQRLLQGEKEMEQLKRKLQNEEEEKRQMQKQYHQEILSIADRQREAQDVIIYHQEHKSENRNLKNTITELTQQLEERKSEIEQILKAKEEEIHKIRDELETAEDAAKTKDIEILAAEEEYGVLETKLTNLRETSDAVQKERANEIASLQQQLLQSRNAVQSAESEMQTLKKEMGKFQNEMTQRQRIISVRDQEILTLKDDARLANERVEALRGQITSMQTLNREMEVEMGETGGVVSQMNEQVRELKNECAEKQRDVDALTKTVSDLEAKGKQSMEQFSKQIESLEEYSKQQEALVESFFEAKQTLQGEVSELQTELVQESKKNKSSQELYEKSQQECRELKAMLDQAQLDVKAAKDSAAAEIEEAAEILAKAESMAQSVQGSLEEASGTTNGAASREEDLLDHIERLEKELQTERHTSSASVELSKKLENEVVSLKQQVSNLQDMEKEVVEQMKLGSDSVTENELISMSRRLSQSLAAEEAALSEIQRLRQQLKELESGAAPLSHSDATAVNSDDHFNDLRRQASRLEAENEKLRKAAHKRNQILAQSRHFIEQYLDRSINSLTDMQP